MKKFLKLVTFLVMLLPFVAKAQMQDPVQWTVETEKVSNNEYNIVFKANIEDGWHLYSQHTPIGGPMPLYFEFVDTLGIERVGGVLEPEAIVKFNNVFEIDEYCFEKEVVFIQKVKLLDGPTKVTGTIFGQSCKETHNEARIQPTTYDFELKLGESALLRLL